MFVQRSFNYRFQVSIPSVFEVYFLFFFDQLGWVCCTQHVSLKVCISVHLCSPDVRAHRAALRDRVRGGGNEYDPGPFPQNSPEIAEDSIR